MPILSPKELSLYRKQLDLEGEGLQPVPPTDIPLWQKGLAYGAKAVETAFEPFKMTGIGLGGPSVMTVPEREQYTDLSKKIQEYQALHGLVSPEELYEAIPELREQPLVTPEEVRERYEEKPVWEQLLWESPAFAALGATGVTAMGLRTALAPAAARGGARAVLPEAARVALAPAAGFEWIVGKTLYYLFGKPVGAAIAKISEARLKSTWAKTNLYKNMPTEFKGTPLEDDFYNAFKLWKKGTPESQKAAGDVLNTTFSNYQKGFYGRPKTPTPEAEPPIRLPVKELALPVKPTVTPKVEAVPEGELGRPLAEPKVKPLAVEAVAPKPAPLIPEVKPLVEISSAQLERIRTLADTKAFIDIKGAYKPQFRRLLIGVLGKGETKLTNKQLLAELSSTEGDTLIDALTKLPKPTKRGRELIPPSIPVTKRVVPSEFFASKFGEPTPVKYITSQTYYAQKLGVKPLVGKLEIGKQTFDLEYGQLARVVEQKINQINKIGGVSIAEKLTAKVKNIPTKAVKEMRNLLNEFEEPPATLSGEQRELFTWFRNLNRTILGAVNKVRSSLGVEQIPYRQAYVRHVADDSAWEIINGQRTLPADLEYWSRRIVSKRIYNPMEMQRELAVDLEEYFTRNLEYATKSMLWTALKEIHLAQPLDTFTHQMRAFSKDLPVYEGLSRAELEQVRRVSVMPASTQKWVTDYVNANIKGQQTETDAMVNRLITQSGLGGMLNTLLKPFGRTLGQRPFTQLAQLSGRMVISATIGPRPKLIIRNLFQNIQNTALYGPVNALRALLPAPSLCKELMAESLFLKGYARFEEMPNTVMGVMERIWMRAYGESAAWNASNGMKAGYYDTLDLITKPKYKEFGWADPARTYTEPKNFLYPSERANLLREMEFGSGATQYQYISMGMPEIFRHKTFIPFTRLQSWWMNYFAKFQREALHRFIKGETSYGKKLPWSRRVNWLKYLVLGGAILTAMGYDRSFMIGVLPHWMSPGGQISIGLYNYLFAQSDWQREKAKKQIFSAWKAIVPGSLAWQDFSDAWSGEKPLSKLFFYTEDWPPHTPSWGITGQGAELAPKPAPKTITERQIEDRMWAKYPAEYRQIAEYIKMLEKTNPAKASQTQQQYPQILSIRRQIAEAKARVRR